MRGLAASRIGTAPGIAAVESRTTTQAWARYLYEHPKRKGFDGLIYHAFHSGLDSLALWARAKRALRTDKSRALGSRAIAVDLDIAAADLGMPIVL